MFKILREALRPGLVTTAYPNAPAEVSPAARNRPAFDWARIRDWRAVLATCPAAAFAVTEHDDERVVRFDLGRCIACGLCAEATDAIRMTNACDGAVRSRAELVTTTHYRRTGAGDFVPAPPPGGADPSGSADRPREDAAGAERLAREVQARAARLFGRSLHIRQVDAGSCNGCEVEIGGLAGPVYDLDRFGIHFVASPRHADMLLVTGPVTRNMELALRKTYAAMPRPRLVVAVGACGCSGGLFGENYATRGAVDAVVPVDVYVPGCPPNPNALLQGILLAIGRWRSPA